MAMLIWSREVIPNQIKNGNWCPVCADKIQYTTEVMQILAPAREGKSQSNDYIATNVKLKWQSKEGHVWEALPLHIKRGS